MPVKAPVSKAHPAFQAFKPWSGTLQTGFHIDFLGGLTRRAFKHWPADSAPPTRFVRANVPPFSEQYVEWISVLSAVLEAESPFTMFELGAGWGTWTVRAVQALRYQDKSIRQLTAVEAEPTHFAFLQQHLADNQVPPEVTQLIAAAVAPADGEVLFTCGAPKAWYGQFVTRRERICPDVEGEPVAVTTVPAVSLQTLLAPFDFVDLVHADLQGAEDGVLAAAAEQLDQKVRRVCVGTHSDAIEANLRTTFGALGWECEIDVPLGEDRETPWGTATFVDGVQSWVNPRYRRRLFAPGAVVDG